jgi:nicotinamide riboside kinase/4'-phosphopantetheinyl transferase EntD
MIIENKIKHMMSAEVNNLGLFGLKIIYTPVRSDEIDQNKNLSNEDLERLRKFKNEKRKREFLSARIALGMIDHDLSKDISYVGRRPMLKSNSGEISLSHSQKIAAAAWHPSLPIGIDVESERQQLQTILTKFLSLEEIDNIRSSKNPDLARRIAWGAKESIYKAANQKGLSLSKDIMLNFIAEFESGKGNATIADGRKYSIGWSLIANDDKTTEALVWAVEHPKTLKIVLTGPESSGKTALCKSLSVHFKSTHIAEYAREYLKKKKGKYDLNDLIQINETQTENHKNIIEPMVFFDTDVITLIIWAKDKFNESIDDFEITLRDNLPHLYLLCRSDLPWVYDPQRENPNDLNRIFHLHEQALKSLKIPFKYIEGKGEARLKNAICAIENQMF